MNAIQIDGAQGEGGGQVLRTSLTLALLTQRPVEVINIRLNRKKPGLLRQHLTCVRAAQAISNGIVEGDELGSSRVLFTPGDVKSGDYHFSISTAGSTSLVCQTILLPLAFANGESKVTFEGGTHNGLAPSVTFLQWSFLPVLHQMGLRTEVRLDKYGFNPAGGGKWELNITPLSSLKPFRFEVNHAKTEQRRNIFATAIVSELPKSIALRELKTVCNILQLDDLPQELKTVDSQGPGNTLIIRCQHEEHSSVFERVGEFGVSAERVAKRTVGSLKKFLRSRASIEEHLADQLLLPMLLSGKGQFTTTEPSLHTLTNIEVVRQITGKRIDVSQISEYLWQISLN